MTLSKRIDKNSALYKVYFCHSCPYCSSRLISYAQVKTQNGHIVSWYCCECHKAFAVTCGVYDKPIIELSCREFLDKPSLKQWKDGKNYNRFLRKMEKETKLGGIQNGAK